MPLCNCPENDTFTSNAVVEYARSMVNSDQVSNAILISKEE